jgi:hypothetical protein
LPSKNICQTIRTVASSDPDDIPIEDDGDDGNADADGGDVGNVDEAGPDADGAELADVVVTGFLPLPPQAVTVSAAVRDTTIHRRGIRRPFRDPGLLIGASPAHPS